MIRSRLPLAVLLAFAWGADCADAHSGRRLQIEVVDGKLQAQGLNTGDPDGAPFVRPYLNAIHDHWSNVEVPGLVLATAVFPEFDITPSAATALQGHGLALELVRVRKWVAPPLLPPPATTPVLEPLGGGQLITLRGLSPSIDSNSLGSIQLIDDVPFGGVSDLGLFYEINDNPVGEIHVLEFLLSATPLAGGSSPIQTSDPVHILLSPAGATPEERLHHASLFLEQYVATVPEPSTCLFAAIPLLTWRLGRGRRPRRAR